MPTHVIGGEHDILVPVWKSREIAELIPGAKLDVLAGAPHGLSLERAEEFNAAVLEFIRDGGAHARGDSRTSRRAAGVRRSAVHIRARRGRRTRRFEHARDRPARGRDHAQLLAAAPDPARQRRTASRRRSSR